LENIEKNREELLNDINTSHLNSKFKGSKVTKLVAVSKKQDENKIDTAIQIGQRIFGENRVQEARQRWEERLKHIDDLELRLIGPLQTNKVKQALKLFDIIETVDREKLAKEIYLHFDNKVKTKSFFIQINTGSESQKSGILPLESDSFIQYCVNDLKLPVIGLMCIPPYDEESAMHFCLLKKIADRNQLSELSMGMSEDFKEGIKFGATSVRIGTKFFGQRTIVL
jgi:pyridoxal phosphate enzyme (YggS family)